MWFNKKLIKLLEIALKDVCLHSTVPICLCFLFFVFIAYLNYLLCAVYAFTRLILRYRYYCLIEYFFKSVLMSFQGQLHSPN